MVRFPRLAALLAAAIAGCAPVGCAPLGGPGSVADRGIGGTGSPSGASVADRGIGGTGINGETAVVGAITGFGSVWVNGLEIGSEGVSDVEVDGVSRPLSVLRVGQFARVVAYDDAAHLRARTIEVQHEASGPVERILPDGGIVVAGQRVRLTPRTLGDAPRRGDWVEVSGPRNAQGGILATRIDRRAPGPVTVSGRLLPAPRGGFRIGGLTLRLPPGADAAPHRVTVNGSLAGRVLVVASIRPAPLLRFQPGLRRLVVEAFVQSNDGGLRVGEGGNAARGAGLGAIPTDAPVVLDLTQGANGGLVATGMRASADIGGGGASSGPGAGPGVGPGPAAAGPGTPATPKGEAATVGAKGVAAAPATSPPAASPAASSPSQGSAPSTGSHASASPASATPTAESAVLGQPATGGPAAPGRGSPGAAGDRSGEHGGSAAEGRGGMGGPDHGGAMGGGDHGGGDHVGGGEGGGHGGGSGGAGEGGKR